MKILKRKSNQPKELGTLSYPVPISNRLAKDINRLLKSISKEYLAHFRPERASDSERRSTLSALEQIRVRYLPRIELLATELANKYVSQLNKYSSKSASNILKDTPRQFNFEYQSPAIKSIVETRIVDFVNMIKSIEEKHYNKITKLVNESLFQEGTKTIYEGILAIENTTPKQAERIAIDQTRKITSTLNAERMKEAGVNQFMWIHSSGSKNPRPLHVEADGQIFDYNDPPRIGDSGEPILPGEAYFCSCRAKPILTF